MKSRAKRFKSGDNKLWSEQELRWFGQLQQPYVDETCPSHAWKEWKCYFDHGSADLFTSNRQLFINAGIIRKLFYTASSTEDEKIGAINE